MHRPTFRAPDASVHDKKEITMKPDDDYPCEIGDSPKGLSLYDVLRRYKSARVALLTAIPELLEDAMELRLSGNKKGPRVLLNGKWVEPTKELADTIRDIEEKLGKGNA